MDRLSARGENRCLAVCSRLYGRGVGEPKAKRIKFSQSRRARRSARRMNRSMVLAEWNRARESLRAAETLTREALYSDAISRAYYAILHGAKAALQIHKVAAESHPAVRRMFGLHLVQSGEMEPEWSAYLTESLDDRLAAGYDAETSFSKKEATSEFRARETFLNVLAAT